MTTEQEAMTLMVCPRTRHPSNNFAGVSCLGSQCLHWRWVRQGPTEQLVPPQPKDMRGYCGSAGSTQ